MSDGEARRAFRIRGGAQRMERDVDEELQFHLEMRTRRLIASGLDPGTARARALAQFGDLAAVRDECLVVDQRREQSMRLTDLVNNVRQDVTLALRSLRHHWGFALVVILILTLSIGANTATFTLVDALLLRRLPVGHAERLVTVGDPSATGSVVNGSPVISVLSYPLYKDLRDASRGTVDLYAMGSAGTLDVLAGADASNADARPTHPAGRFVTGNYFDVLQLHAYLGRTFTAREDEQSGRDPVAVLSYGYWNRTFGADGGAIGQRLMVNGVALTIIGVMPAAFGGDVVGSRTDLWIPMAMQPVLRPSNMALTDRSLSWLLLMGRLSPGITLERARNELRAVAARSLEATMTDTEWNSHQESVRAHPLQVEPGAKGFSYYRTAYAEALAILMAGVALVLLVACANLANMMLARGTSRLREMSVRLALGASRLRLVQQLLTENLILAILAAALGVFAALWGSHVLLVIASPNATPIPINVHADPRVLAFAAGTALLSVVLFGIIPALRATRVELIGALRSQGRGTIATASRPGRVPLGAMLVVIQVALSMWMLIGTGLLLTSMHRISTLDLGVARDQLVLVDVEAQRSGYSGERLAALMRDIVTRAERIPGVTGATLSENGIFSGTESSSRIRIPGYTMQSDSEAHAPFDAVGPKYFHTVGARILRGRDFEERDAEGSAKVAVINETMARFYFSGADPIGRTIVRGDSTYTIVGVGRDIEEQDVRAGIARRIYLSIFQTPHRPGEFNLEVRVARNPSAAVAPIRDAVLAADRSLSISVKPLDDLVAESVSQDRLVTQVISFFGALALALAALGLYGTLSYTTARRTSEFGLRMALGASASGIVRMILGESLKLTLLGTVIGVPAGIGAARLIRGYLFGVGAFDPGSAVPAVVVLAATSIVAAMIPALRAAHVAPVDALRSD